MSASMNVLVCGGAGYIGSHMVKVLQEHGHNPVVFDNLSTGHAESIPEEMLVRGDLRDISSLRRVFAEHSFDAVMHFAARSIVAESVEKPAEYYENNVAGTLNLLNAMMEEGVRRFVFSSTAAVYGNPIGGNGTATSPARLIDEEHSVAPLNPYGRTKLHVEQALRDFAVAYGLRSVSLRYFNAAGADPSGEIGESHEPETHLIPNILRAALGTGPVLRIFGDDYDTPDGTCVRDYIHVNDLADAHLRALGFMQEERGAHVFNLGNGKGFSVREVLAAACEVTGKSIPHEVSPRRSGDAAVLVADSAKARRALGWQPRYADLRELMETAWRWHGAQRY